MYYCFFFLAGLNTTSTLSLAEDYPTKTSTTTASLPAFGSRFPTAFGTPGSHRSSPYGGAVAATPGSASAYVDSWTPTYGTADVGSAASALTYMTNNRGSRVLNASASLSASKSLK